MTDKTQQEIAQALAGLEPALDVRVAYVDVPERPGYQVITLTDGYGVSVRIRFMAVRITKSKAQRRSCHRYVR